MSSSFSSAIRPAALTTGPLTLAGLVLLVGAVVVEGGDDDLAIATSPLASASSVCAMAGLVVLALAVFRIAQEVGAMGSGLGRVATFVAFIGTLLAVGGEWSILFVVPGLARMEPELAEAAARGIPLVQAGYIASYLILAIGWLLVAIVLLRSRAVPRWSAITLLAGALICVMPLPVRFFVIAIAVSLLEAKVLGNHADAEAGRRVASAT